MDRVQYQNFAKIDQAHWWFGARRQIAAALLSRMSLKSNLSILDFGTGTGGMLPVLAKFGTVTAFEPDIDTLDFTRQTYQPRFPAMRFISGDPKEIIAGAGLFDLITAFDVLEHCENDVETLLQWKSMLNKDGRILLTVPAFQCLWGRNDVLSHHFRRYRVSSLVASLKCAGLEARKSSYMNSINFLPVWLSRNIKERIEARMFPTKERPWDFSLPPAPLNYLLEASFAWEKHLLPIADLPIGTSLIAIVERP
jgi:SAM-dependent methyltransferase